MATIKRFEELEIWQLARQLCIEVEKLVKEGLGNKNIRLKDQIQGSSGSVMDNIAEGFEKENTREFINYLYHSKGSCGETRSQLIRIMDFGYFETERIKKLIADAERISVKTKTFIVYLNNTQFKGQRHVHEALVPYGEKVEEYFAPENHFFEMINNFSNDQTSNDQTSNDQTSNDQTSNDQTSNDQTSNDQTSNDQTSNDQTEDYYNLNSNE
jgi:four helix bundle protein